jgi:uncharacterized phiE125 gp8 family phage protein
MSFSSLIRTSPPAADIMTLAEARAQIRLDATGSPASHPDDTLVQGLIAAVTDYLDGYDGILGRALITQTWVMKLDRFPASGCAARLPLAPLQSIDSITYVDADGATQTLASSVYQVTGAGAGGGGHFRLAYNQSWPSVRDQAEAVSVTFTCGYGDAATDVPAILRHAAKMLIAHFYENREEVIAGNGLTVNELPMGARSIISMMRLRPVA